MVEIVTLGIITTPVDKILLGVRKRKGAVGEGKLCGPGGKIEPGETLKRCLVRETEVEVGIRLNELRLEKCVEIMFHFGGVPSIEMHGYRTSYFTGELRETDEMIPDWYDLKDLPKLVHRMFESDRAWLPYAILGRKFQTNVYYRGRAEGFIGIGEFLPLDE